MMVGRKRLPNHSKPGKVSALTFPGFEWLGNRLRPTIMGLPFSFAYNVAWVVMTFFVLLAFYRGEEGHRP